MKILFLTTHANTGGITSYILTLGAALVKLGYKVFVVSSGGDSVPMMEAVGIQHIQMDIRTKSEIHPKLWLSLPVLKALIQKEGINIIHAQTRVTQVLGTVLSRLTGVRMITTCHGFFKPRWFRKTFPCWGVAVIAISKPVSQHLSVDFGVSQKDVYLISNGIDLNRFVMTTEERRQEIRQKMDFQDEPLVGIVARLSDVKGIDVLICAMPRILEAMPSVKLMIVGQGKEEANLRKLVQDLSIKANVHFRDTIQQTQEILPAFDVFAMPSLMEGLGLSVMEAQACGIPVVASKVGGLVDLIDDGKSGYLVDANDPMALADRILDIFRNPEVSRAMAKEARHNIEKWFSSEIMVRETVQIYEQYSCC